MRREDIPRRFKAVVADHLKRSNPQYKNGRFPISEKALQIEMADAFREANLPFSRERKYPGNTILIDFELFGESAVHIEIEWEAKLTDGFAMRTFHDLHKLDKIPKGAWGMFLALNVGDKYSRPTRETRTKDARSFYTSPRGYRTLLAKKWDDSAEHDLLRCNPMFWRWPYGPKYSVTVLTCYGRNLGNSRWSPEP